LLRKEVCANNSRRAATFSFDHSGSCLELAATTLQVENENLSSAISRIRDVDVAEESTQYAKYDILVQFGPTMLAQANRSP